MQLQENISLKKYNTFGIEVIASHFGRFGDLDTLTDLLHFKRSSPLLVLGGGSNILLTRNFEGLVLKNEVVGIQQIAEDDLHVYVKVGAGENWNGFVNYCLDHNWAGVENLSLIPGNTGAAPMQNIGAYGVELREVFLELEAFHLGDRKVYTFSNNDCEFGYRESIFKRKYKGSVIILSVTFRLNKVAHLHTSYGAIEQELERMKVGEKNIRNVAQAVVNIRRAKLPDPQKIGNAGSFFKNPSIPISFAQILKQKFPDMPGYPNPDETMKIPAAWLIEQCGWKGYRKGDAGCHTQQPLVLVNYGYASGKEIYELSEDIAKSVFDRFEIRLETEVNII